MKLYFTIGIFMLLWLARLSAPVGASRHEAAAGWMVEAQAEDGSWGADGMGIETRAYITSNALLSLVEYASGEDLYLKSIESGARWLKDGEFEDVATLSAAALVLDRAYLETENVEFEEREKLLLDRLLEAQNGDGGWGEKEGAQSMAWHTVEAVVALLLTNSPGEASARGAGYLIDEQLSDGSWEHAPLVTASSVTALALVFAEDGNESMLDSALEGQAWLIENQEPGGEWFHTFTTGRGLVALRVMNVLLGDAAAEKAIGLTEAWLYGTQNPDGSWGMLLDEGGKGSVLATSCALSSLIVEIPVEPLEPAALLDIELGDFKAKAGEELMIELNISNVGYVNLIDLDAEVALEDGERIRSSWRVPLGSALKRGSTLGKEVRLRLPEQVSGSYNITAVLSYATERDTRKRLEGAIACAGIDISSPPIERRDIKASLPTPTLPSPDDFSRAPVLLISAALLVNLLFAPDIGGV